MNEQILTVESANGLDAGWIAENVDHEQAVVWWEHPVSRHWGGGQYVGEIPPRS